MPPISQVPRALAAGVAGVVLAGIAGAGYVVTRDEGPTEVIDAWAPTTVEFPDDRLDRYVVTIDRASFTAGAAGRTVSGAVAETGSTSDDVSAPLDVSASAGGVDEAALMAAVARMQAAGGRPVLRFLDDGAYVVDRDGAVPSIPVPFDGEVAPADPPATEPGSTAEPGGGTDPSGGTEPARASGRPSDRDVAVGLEESDGVAWAEPIDGDRFMLVVERGSDPDDVPGVERSARSRMVQLADAPLPSEPDGARLWWAPNTHVGDAWTRSTGDGVVIAIVDSGIDTTRIDAALWQNPDEVCGNGRDDDNNGKTDDCNGWNFFTNTADVGAPRGSNGVPLSYHGTAVAASAAAAINGTGGFGMAPGARIMALPFGTEQQLSEAAGIAAINYAVAEGADIINCSWGGQYGISAAMDAALARAQDKGVLVVVAAGNNATDASRFSPASSTRPNVLTVGATGVYTNASEGSSASVFVSDNAATFSNYSGLAVDLHAPGTGIWLPSTTLGRSTWWNGTSFSAPLTAGAAAVVKSLQPNLSGITLRSMLMASVDPVPSLGGYSVTGGRLNIAKAVDLVPAIRTEYRDLRAEPVDGGSTTPVAAAVHLTGAAPADLPAATDLGVTVGLVRRGDGQRGLDGTAVTVGDTEATLRSGVATVPVAGLTPNALAAAGGSGLDVTVRVPLPVGEYALVTQVVDASGTPVTSPVGARFYVGDPNAAPAPTVTPTSGPISTPAPGPTGPGPAPTSSAPATVTPVPVVPPQNPGPAPTGAPAPGPAPTSSSPQQPGPAPTGAPAPGPVTTSSSAPQPGPTGGAPQQPGPAPTSSSPQQPGPAPTGAPAPGPVTTSSSAPQPGPTGGAPQEPGPAPTSSSPQQPGPAPTSSSPQQPPATTAAPQPAPTVSVPPTNHFGITMIYPASGPMEGSSLVAVYGNDLPLPPYVRLGGSLVPVLFASNRQVVFLSPQAYGAGAVDLVVCARDGRCDTVRSAYTYTGGGRGDDPAPAPTQTSYPVPTYPAPGPTDPGGPAPTYPVPTYPVPTYPVPGPTGTSNPQPGPTGPANPAPTNPAPGPTGTSAAPQPTQGTSQPADPQPTASTPASRIRTVESVLGSAQLFTTLPSPCTAGTCATVAL